MKFFFRVFFILGVFQTSWIHAESSQPPQGSDVPIAGQETRNGGNLDILEWKGVARQAQLFVRSNADVLGVSADAFDQAIEKTEVVSGDELHPIDLPLRSRDGLHELNPARWRAMKEEQKKSLVLNFYLLQLRPLAQTGGELDALNFIVTQTQLMKALYRGEFPKTAALVNLKELYRAQKESWIVVVDHCVLNGEEKTGINYPARKLIFVNQKSWRTTYFEASSVVRASGITLHEYLGVIGTPEPDYAISSVLIA